MLEITKGTWIEAIFAKKKEPLEKIHFSSESQYDENGNRKVVENDDEDDDDNDRLNRDDEDEDTDNDETFYRSYTPEADIKNLESELDED